MQSIALHFYLALKNEPWFSTQLALKMHAFSACINSVLQLSFSVQNIMYLHLLIVAVANSKTNTKKEFGRQEQT